MTIETAPLAARAQTVAEQKTELSIVVPCLNEAATLEGCVRRGLGLLAANGAKGDAIVAGNGGTDASPGHPDGDRPDARLRDCALQQEKTAAGAQPRVVVVVPAYNYASFLPHALDSVLAQSFTAWECVIVDDGSTDNTPALADSYVRGDPRFRYVRQANAGPSAARNRGIGISHGEYLQFLDADDWLAPDKLAEHVRYLDEHPECGLVYGNVTFFRSDNPWRQYASLHGHLSEPIMARVHGMEEAKRKLDHYNIMPMLAALVRRSVAEAAGGFDEATRGFEDYSFWIRCAAAGARFDFYAAPSVVASVRAHMSSSSGDHVRMFQGLIAAARSFQQSQIRWEAGRLPLLYEVALGADDVQCGSTMRGVRRIRSAASAATETMTRIRWLAYALAAAILPTSLFMRAIAAPMPERPFEIYRRLVKR